MRLLVTGGAGFIGSGLRPPPPGGDRRRDRRPRQADLRRQSRQPRGDRVRRERSPAVRFVHGDICDAALVGSARREVADAVVNFAAESHVDRSILAADAFLRTGVIGVHVLLDAARRADADGPACAWSRSRPTRSTAASRRATAREDDPLRAAQPVRRGQGGRRAAVPRLPRDARHGRRDHPRRQHLRSAPASREAHPAVHHQRARRPAAAAVRRRPAAARLAARRRPRRRGRASCSITASRGWRTTCRRGQERANREVAQADPGAAGQAWSLVRSVPDRPGHDRRYAMDGTRMRRLAGGRALASRTGWRQRSTGTRPIETGGNRREAQTGMPGTRSSTRRGWSNRRRQRDERSGLPASASRSPAQTVERDPLSWRRCAAPALRSSSGSRPDYDLDDPSSAARMVARDKPEAGDSRRRLDGRGWLRARSGAGHATQRGGHDRACRRMCHG